MSGVVDVCVVDVVQSERSSCSRRRWREETNERKGILVSSPGWRCPCPTNCQSRVSEEVANLVASPNRVMG